MDLKNKTILITGSSGGIGKSLVTRLTHEDVKVLLISKSKNNLPENQNQKSYFCDLSKREEITRLINQIKKENTNIDVLVNIAGIGIYKPIEEVNYEEWDNSYAINVTAPFVLTKELLPLFNKQESLVLNIGSGAGVIPMKNRLVYCSTKFALRGLTLSLVEEFKDKQPSFCLITLGSTLTPFGIGQALTLEQKIKQHQEGAAYFTAEWVANKLVEIIKDKNRKSEIVLYPGDYGFGTWKKP